MIEGVMHDHTATASYWSSCHDHDLTVDQNDVHLWWCSLEQADMHAKRLSDLLSVDEWGRAQRFRFAEDKKSFITCRGLLRTVLGRYLHIDPKLVQFEYGPDGKPGLAKALSGNNLHFNVTHSKKYALYAIARGREVGVDLEYMRPISNAEQIARHCFSASEYSTLQGLSKEKRIVAFYNCWTRKEAYLKAGGEGLTRPLDQFDVTVTPGKPARLLRVEWEPKEIYRWSLEAVTAPAGYVATLAVEGQNWSLTGSWWIDECCREHIPDGAAVTHGRSSYE